jgi:hypothetical protein
VGVLAEHLRRECLLLHGVALSTGAENLSLADDQLVCLPRAAGADKVAGETDRRAVRDAAA